MSSNETNDIADETAADTDHDGIGGTVETDHLKEDLADLFESLIAFLGFDIETADIASAGTQLSNEFGSIRSIKSLVRDDKELLAGRHAD